MNFHIDDYGCSEIQVQCEAAAAAAHRRAYVYNVIIAQLSQKTGFPQK